MNSKFERFSCCSSKCFGAHLHIEGVQTLYDEEVQKVLFSIKEQLLSVKAELDEECFIFNEKKVECLETMLIEDVEPKMPSSIFFHPLDCTDTKCEGTYKGIEIFVDIKLRTFNTILAKHVQAVDENLDLLKRYMTSVCVQREKKFLTSGNQC